MINAICAQFLDLNMYIINHSDMKLRGRNQRTESHDMKERVAGTVAMIIYLKHRGCKDNDNTIL